MNDSSDSEARHTQSGPRTGDDCAGGGVPAKRETLRRYEELIRALELRIWPQNRLEGHRPDQGLLKQLEAYREEADRLFVDIAEMTGKPPLTGEQGPD